MKYLALIATIGINNLAAAQGEVAAKWQLGQYSVSIGEKCVITVSTPASKEIIANGFNNDRACKVAYLAQTNIPNAYVIGGAHILIVEQQTIQQKSCRRVSKALYLPTDGQHRSNRKRQLRRPYRAKRSDVFNFSSVKPNLKDLQRLRFSRRFKRCPNRRDKPTTDGNTCSIG
ncbi:hypothetical protein [Pseudoalteromonas piscicida]|uniref:hypothetical protein n=1 Tax=Pseudoalteromonas piscicida TaxID=43662 RepID=UPI001FD45EEE|nr:hypothetical protein [Pseudoalteromonas piscicida]